VTANGPRTPVERIHALDSLRGIAALTVLLGHTVTVCEWEASYSRMPIINNLFDGRSAVTMFLVLSGFVLTYASLDNNRPLKLVSFYLRRFTRIWIPWFAVFCLSIVVKRWLFSHPVGTHPPLASNFLLLWSERNSPGDLMRQMVFILHNAHRMYIPQDWSLGVELKGSLLIPLLVIVARARQAGGRGWAWARMALLGLLFLWIKPDTGYYYASFAVGVAVASISARWKIPGHGMGYVLLGYVLYQARWCSVAFLAAAALSDVEKWVWLVTTVGCGLIIYGVMKPSPLRNLLESPSLVFLGRVSYSLYLVQVILIVCLAPWCVYGLNRLGVESPALIQPLLLLTLAACCLALSAVTQRWIEEPCIHLGRILTTRIEQMPALSRWRV